MILAPTHDLPLLVSLTPGPSDTPSSTAPTTSIPSPLRSSRKTKPSFVLSDLRCTHEKCKFSKATFTRKSDLERHVLKHEGNTFDCSAVGCNRRGIKAFYRPDKLGEHIRRAHGHGAQFYCPYQGCQFGPVALVLLGVHMASFHGYSGAEAWKPVLSTPFCPLKPCRKPMKSALALARHLRLNHSERDRLAQTSTIFGASFDAVSCKVICPVCGERAENATDTFYHVLLDHMVDKVHFQAWVTTVNEHGARYRDTNADIGAFMVPKKILCELREVLCPKCPQRPQDIVFFLFQAI
jgi:hypothetical protein